MKRTIDNSVIGFIGTGVMGLSMAGHLLKNGFSLHVYSRTKAKAESLIQQGAIWHDSPASLAQAADVILTMVGYPKDVEDVYLGEHGVIHHVRPGSLLIDLTTSIPALAKEIERKALERELQFLDAPVSGGDIGAREARLSIMVGGSEEAFENAVPVLEVIGTTIVHQGPSGSGQYTKMCNQIAIAAKMVGVCESIKYAEASGLDPATVLRSIEFGAAGSWTLSNLAPRIIQEDYAPGFYVKHFIKDMQIALDSSKELGLKLPGLSLARALYEQLAEIGEENSGTHALYKVYQYNQVPVLNA
ncbi:NAD(P)-dependent oxidoreductase [Paenibacillus roseipurpureus]|uniref:NAD(P)-dependent oxidoreductase n=1 Tax=Paenibacillus roseopurpureus TaxID=2918901 RepID=A0AA96LT65_9BACL|nr:NAD(P)-dependent oxidoreductase [Paenibacillus sp. MBLB1832]WNR46831.1 NAD(P)-dependent oxidoreductase [Paenibacillus sp. MBLB1832]